MRAIQDNQRKNVSRMDLGSVCLRVNFANSNTFTCLIRTSQWNLGRFRTIGNRAEYWFFINCSFVTRALSGRSHATKVTSPWVYRATKSEVSSHLCHCIGSVSRIGAAVADSYHQAFRAKPRCRKMAGRVMVAVVAMVAVVMAVAASDPELTVDFFVPVGTDKATLTGDYFTSMVFRGAPAIVAPAKLAVKRITSDTFPVLTGLGVSNAMIKYLPGGINPPHTHPRGTETLYVLEGTLTVGLLDTTNKFYTKVLECGDLFVFPKGLVHYQFNQGSKPVVAFISFSSSNPGTVSLPIQLFGSGIPDAALMAGFKVDNNVVNRLQAAQGQK